MNIDKYLNCKNNGYFSDLLGKFYGKSSGTKSSKPNEIQKIINTINKYNLKDITCNSDYMHVVLIILAIFVILLIYNKFVKSSLNKYVNFIDNWMVTTLMIFVFFNYIVGEDTFTSIVMALLLSFAYSLFIRRHKEHFCPEHEKEHCKCCKKKDKHKKNKKNKKAKTKCCNLFFPENFTCEKFEKATKLSCNNNYEKEMLPGFDTNNLAPY